MKRVLIVLVVLLLLGGVVFYFGWIQIRIPAGSYAVIFTRTNGWEPRAIESGTFVWRWQRLIPTNLSLYVFAPERHTTEARLQGNLPSGKTMDILLDQAGDFPYDVRITVGTRLDPESLPGLARDEGLRPEDLSDYYDELDARISQLATEALMSLVDSQPAEVTMSSAYSSVVDAVTQRIENNVAGIVVTTVTPQRIELPDVELYQEARRLSVQVLEARSTAMQEAAREIAQEQTQIDRSLSMLEQYAEILNEYPVLLDYFRVAQEIDGDPLDLESLIPDSGQ